MRIQHKFRSLFNNKCIHLQITVPCLQLKQNRKHQQLTNVSYLSLGWICKIEEFRSLHAEEYDT
jgi:hypothetical protein